MQYETILYDKRNSVAIITLNRPDRLNAINRQVLDELEAACGLAEEDGEVRAVVLTGAGKTFSSGFDLKEQAKSPPQGVKEWEPVLQGDFDGVMRFWHMSKPTIAAVRGYVLAGAFEMMLACDLTIAAEGSVFGEPELKFGAGIVVMLAPWYVGPKIAKQIILMADDQISAERALELGFINKIVPEGEEVTEAISQARKLSSMDPMIVRRTKAAINRSYEIMGLLQALDMALDVDLAIEGEGSDDKRNFLKLAREKGLRAALDWRESRFSGDD
jgi:enoyl-CoA hydratase